jgi:hypothetical protein
MALTTLNSRTVLAVLTTVWDLPTIAQEYPEVTDWLTERLDVDSDMAFQVVLVDKKTGKPFFTDTFDRRTALQSWLLANPDA